MKTIDKNTQEVISEVKKQLIKDILDKLRKNKSTSSYLLENGKKDYVLMEKIEEVMISFYRGI